MAPTQVTAIKSHRLVKLRINFSSASKMLREGSGAKLEATYFDLTRKLSHNGKRHCNELYLSRVKSYWNIQHMTISSIKYLEGLSNHLNLYVTR